MGVDGDPMNASSVANLRTCLPVWYLTVIVLGTAGCLNSHPEPRLDRIYGRAAQGPDYSRNPVIVIPGILGSRLIDGETGRVAWGKFERTGFLDYGKSRIASTALPMKEGAPLAQLRDSIKSDGTLAYLEIELPGRLVEIEAYGDILSSLGVGGYRDAERLGRSDVPYSDEHFTCFQFDYDWRRDIAETAGKLSQFIEDRKMYIRREYERRYGIRNADIKFDIVAHSMGGMVARYYLRYGSQPLPDDGSLPSLNWSGARNVRKVVLVGTPNAGSALAVRDLVDGYHLSRALPAYPAAILGTMPAVYQLLPRTRHGSLIDSRSGGTIRDLCDASFWKEMNWGLADPRQDSVLKELLPTHPLRKDRLRIALDHQRKCLARAKQLHQALDIPAAPPEGVSLHLFAGDAIDTPSVIAVDRRTGRVKVASYSPGDDTTTRASAVMEERIDEPSAGRPLSPIYWTSTMFLRSSHRNETSDPMFTNNVLALLLDPRHEPLEVEDRSDREVP